MSSRPWQEQPLSACSVAVAAGQILHLAHVRGQHSTFGTARGVLACFRVRALLCVRCVRANERRCLPACAACPQHACACTGVRRVPMQARTRAWQHDRDRISVQAVERDRVQGLSTRHGAYGSRSAWFRCGSAACRSAGHRRPPRRPGQGPAAPPATGPPCCGSAAICRLRLRLAQPRVHTQLDARACACTLATTHASGQSSRPWLMCQESGPRLRPAAPCTEACPPRSTTTLTPAIQTMGPGATAARARWTAASLPSPPTRHHPTGVTIGATNIGLKDAAICILSACTGA